MTRLLLTAAFALIAVPAFAADDPVVHFSEDDPVMNAAIAKARDSLPTFWAKFKAPAANEDGFTLKLGISDGNYTEHFWCADIVGDATKATCVINNEPAQVFTVKFGERVDVDPAIISDWMYLRDGLIVGGETVRVIVDQMPEDEAADLRAMLADE
jgi:uncharacterized protein YegJ (DUF2314 family)